MRDTVKTYCGLCHPRCGLLLDIEDGKARGVRGDPDHPISRGKICARGRTMVEHLHHLKPVEELMVLVARHLDD